MNARRAGNLVWTIIGVLALVIAFFADVADAENLGGAQAETGVTIIAARAIRAETVVTPADLRVIVGKTPGAASRIEDVAGREARVTLYPNRPVMLGQLGPPALVERNDLVTLTYRRGPLTIETEGRALGRGGEGERVRVMNLSSRVAITGRVAGPAHVEVAP